MPTYLKSITTMLISLDEMDLKYNSIHRIHRENTIYFCSRHCTERKRKMKYAFCAEIGYYPMKLISD